MTGSVFAYQKCEHEKLKKLDRMVRRILTGIGIRILSRPFLDRLSDRGLCIRNDRVVFSCDQITQLPSQAPDTFALYGINPAHDIILGGELSHMAAGYGCASIMDPDGNIRSAIFQDHVDLVKLVHVSSVFHINGGILAQPSDVAAGHSHLAMMYAALTYSDKCIFGIPGSREHMEDIMALAAIRLGGSEAFAQKPRILTMISPVSPLQVDETGLEALDVAGRYHQPVIISPGVAAGTTGPIDLAGNVAMAAAEALGLIMIAQVLNPGTPVIFGLQCYGSDMKSGNISIGSPAYALQAKYCAALARYYHLPSRAGGAVNDAKNLSAQAGYESMLSMFTAMQNRVNLIVHSAGILDSFAAISFEKFIMDLEIIEMIRFYMDDMVVDDTTLNFDLIQSVGPGGLFLTTMDTMKKCRTHAWNPNVALRGNLMGMSPHEKLLKNIQTAREQMLAQYEQPVIDPDTVHAMNAFMKKKGVDPADLPLYY
ncbi:MAG: trimethylamine methyltransferase family protein [Desulfotignum sp.]|nr:trimethylamine methyltransferase family protein [Desulfotignum sp.]MCF8125470.1 trimethylamine methyltransferase family protein [Desulfotignum sp.]